MGGRTPCCVVGRGVRSDRRRARDHDGSTPRGGAGSRGPWIGARRRAGWHADGSTRQPVKKGTRFEIGSISKSFAAIVAIAAGRVRAARPERPRHEYVPWFEVRAPYEPITPHHLLTHTAGLIQGMDFADDAVPPSGRSAAPGGPFAPGEHFHYSNDGYKLLGLILETIGGRPWPDMLRERVLEPLGMDRTDPEITYETAADIATPTNARPTTARRTGAGVGPAPRSRSPARPTAASSRPRGTWPRTGACS